MCKQPIYGYTSKPTNYLLLPSLPIYICKPFGIPIIVTLHNGRPHSVTRHFIVLSRASFIPFAAFEHSLYHFPCHNIYIFAMSGAPHILRPLSLSIANAVVIHFRLWWHFFVRKIVFVFFVPASICAVCHSYIYHSC